MDMSNRIPVSVVSLITIFIFAIILAAPARAEDPAPIQFSFFDFNAPEKKAVSGVRFPAIYGKNGGDITGLDLQLLAFSEMDSMTGVSFPLLVAGANRIKGEMNGVSVGLFNWHEGQDTGLNLGFLNITNNVNGLNWSFVNVSEGHTVADVGAISVSQESNFQLGIVNVTQKLDGVQLGLLNCAKNGFLPCFILFNYGTK